ncbi:hypothetical protein H4R18_003143 [Coemansia javaensis]|uniref:G-patch domain-containing protein n=1 Tax=Coemansia javaensis TaxID=2761396 RepID=A0A9W8HEQ5_9FUNG|nr:hypothetical protein H4R18_003143 [Coemansia javaensis]
MLGMWADEDNVGAGDAVATADLTRPTQFVPAREAADRTPPRSDPGSSSGSDSNSGSGSSSDSGTGSDSDTGSESGSGPSGRRRPPAQDGAAAAPEKTRLPSKEFGKFAGSAVWAMMAKMGYKPGQGLGKHGEGRVEPIEVQVRRAGEGISFSGSEAPSTPKAAQRPKTRPAAAATPGRQRPATGTARAAAEAEAARRRTEYKTLEELERRTEAQARELFVDMTSGTEAGSLAELLAARLPRAEKDRLASDTRLGLDLAFARLEGLALDKAAEESRVRALRTEVETLERSAARRARQVEGLRSIDEAISAVDAASQAVRVEGAESAAGDMAPLYAAFERLRAAAAAMEASCGFDVWGELRLERAVAGAVHPHFLRLFRTWDPAAAPSLYADLVDPLRPYVRAAGAGTSSSSSDGPGDAMTPFESLLNRTLVPRLKQLIYTAWDPWSDDDLSRILAGLPPAIAVVAAADVGAVLQREVDKTNPRVAVAKFVQDPGAQQSALGPLRLDRAVIPWLPFIPDARELLVCVRRKLCTALDCWVPSRDTNDAIAALVSPWLEVLRGKERARVAARVAERLDAMLRAEFEFNAQKQTLWPFKALVKWHAVLPPDVWAPLARRSVLARFLDYLRRWLEAPGADYAQVADWYWQWRLLFPADAIAHPEIQGAFREALVCMCLALDQRGL